MRAHYRDVVAASLPSGVVPLGGASVSVVQTGTSTPITESIYSGASGAVTLANPLTSDVQGVAEFWLEREKRVDLVTSKTGFNSVRATVDVQEVELAVVDVTDFGATGDGVTDDTV